MSDDEATQSSSERTSVRRAVKSMPRWKKSLIGLSLVLALVGGGAQIASAIGARSVREEAAGESAPQTTPGTSGLLPAGSAETSTPPEEVAPPPSPLQRMAPHLTRIGGSFFAALVLGMIFRTFIKTAAMITAGAAGLFFVLTYFNVLNLDVAGMQTQYDSVVGWVSTQAGRLKDVVFAALPSSTSAAAGFFVGFKR
jgi:uncharacterized membrane protein (Fun14 family)